MAENKDSGDSVNKFIAEMSKSFPDKAPLSENPKGLNRDEVLEGAREGEVFSIKSRKPISLSEKGRIVNQQIKDVERGPLEPLASEAESVSTVPEGATEQLSPEFEKARAEWKEARDRAHKIEEEYRQKYHEHVLAHTKGIRGLINIPRRMFGLHPRLNRELESLQEASLAARISYKEAGLKLKETKSVKDKTIGEVEKLSSRYQRMLAHHLIVAVHKERLAKQKEGVGQAWEESKYLRPTMENLGKHKYTVGAVALGAGILTAGIVPVVAGVVAGVSTRIGLGRILDKTYVESARKNLAEGKKSAGKDFFEAELADIDDEIEHLTFAVDTREARAKTITNTAAIAAGIGAAGYVNGLGAENVNNFSDIPPKIPSEIIPETSNGGFVDSTTLEPLNIPNPSEVDSLSAPDATVGESLSDTAPNIETPVDKAEVPATEVENKPETTNGGLIERDAVPAVESSTEESVPRDYSMPPATSVPNLPPQGIIETVPPAPEVATPIESGPQIDNLSPITESEATAAFGPVTGPSIESLQSADLVTHTVEKGDNVWNILEGKGPDANPIGGKSEVLEGMSLSDRHAALDKLIEYAEQNPEFAKEVGAVKSNGDIHRVYPGEEINVSMLDDKLRELLGIGETTESTAAGETPASNEELGKVEIQPEPVIEQAVKEPGVATYSEAAPEPYDINSMRVGDILSMQEAVENGDPQILAELKEMGLDQGSYNALNEAISSNIRQGETYDMTLPLSEWMNQYGQPTAPEPAVVPPPQPNSSPVLDRVSYTPSDSGTVAGETITPAVENVDTTVAVNKYVTGVEKPSGFIFTKPDVSGTFEALKGLSIAEFKAMAGNDNLPSLLQERGVSYDGFERWGETLQDQVKLIPANDTETVGDYVTRIANANARTA